MCLCSSSVKNIYFPPKFFSYPLFSLFLVYLYFVCVFISVSVYMREYVCVHVFVYSFSGTFCFKLLLLLMCSVVRFKAGITTTFSFFFFNFLKNALQGWITELQVFIILRNYAKILLINDLFNLSYLKLSKISLIALNTKKITKTNIILRICIHI